MDKRTVCVGIVTFNRKDFLEKLLDTLIDQTYKVSGILIVDNNSSDGTPDLLINKGVISQYEVECIASTKWNDIDIIYFRNSENLGGSGGFNKLFDLFLKTEFDCIWSMDDDVKAEPDCLEKMMEYLTPEARLCVPCRGDENYADYANTGYDLKTLRYFRFQDCKRDRIESKLIKEPYVEIKDMAFEGPLFTRDLVEEIGLPDAGYFILFDDTDYACRAAKVTTLRYITGAILHKQLLPAKASSNKWEWKAYYKVRNSVYLEHKLGENIRVRHIRPLLRIGDLFVRAVLRGRFSRAKWIAIAYIDGVRGNMGRTYDPKDLVIE